MSEISNRFLQAIEFVKRNKYARSDAQIARSIGIPPSALNMAKKGERVPTWDMLLKFCDHFPISFWWLRSGEGDMIGNGDRQVALLQKIAELERKLSEIERK